MSRQKICAGNWKMYKSPAQVEGFFRELAGLLNAGDRRLVIFPPAYCLPALQDATDAFARADFVLDYGAQNIHFQNEGAFTGEISPAVVKELKADFALIGHSERRTIFGETDELVAKKVKAAVAHKLIPMLCIGETLAERDAGSTNAVVLKQLREGLAQIDVKEDEFVIAYEPVWAIGTGRTATPEQAEEVHKFIRTSLRELAGEKVTEKTPILYGGSVKPDNAAGLIAKPNIDGFLIGGASLKPADFAAIANAMK